MAKKSFKADNPALQFISGPAASEPAPKAAPKPKRTAQEMKPTQSARPARPKAQPAPSTTGEERKTKRLNLLLQPSIMDDLKKIAAMKQTSVNDLINSVLKDYNLAEKSMIEKYDRVFGK